MSCSRTRRALELRADDALSLEGELRLLAHLASCERCRALEERIQLLEEAWTLLDEPALEHLDVEAAVHAVRSAAASPAPPTAPSRWRRSGPWLAAATAAALVLVLTRSAPQADSSAERNEVDAPPAAQLVRESLTPSPAAETPAPSVAVVAESAPSASDRERDRDRLAGARAAVRTILERAGQGMDAESSQEAVTSLVLSVDEDAAQLRQSGWPLVRLVEGMVDDEDLVVAGAACLYLGRQGDSLSARIVGRALQRADLAPLVVRALLDLGPLGRPALAPAVEAPLTRAQVLAGLQQAEDEGALELFARAYLTSASQAEESDDLLTPLAAAGPAGLERLAALHATGALEDETYQALVRATEGAADWFAAKIPSARRQDLRSVLLGAASVAPDAAASWLEQHLHDRSTQLLTRELLPRVEGRACVEVLLRLAQDPRLSSAELAELTTASLVLDSERFVRAASPTSSFGASGRRALADLLLAVEERESLGPLVQLLASPELEDSVRAEIAVRLGGQGVDGALPALVQTFDACSAAQHHLAAACLLAVAREGGEEAASLLLDHCSRRTRQNILSLLKRRPPSERTSSSIYKLARELKSSLSERDRDTQRASS